ncbi:MAG: PP2C family protein-serine/threonine phosphatase [Cellvibrionales bacterium]
MEFCSRSHRGRVKRKNEDTVEVREDSRLVVIADGIGGRHFGEVASQLAVDASLEYLSSSQSLKEKPINELSNAIKFANEAIIAVQANDLKYQKMGSTLTCLWLDHRRLHFSWVGDSRVYLLKAMANSIQMLTRDHTLNRANIDAKWAPNLYKRAPSILTQHVGSILLLKPDTGSVDLEPGDVVLACTDGLTNRITDDLILEYALTHCDDLHALGDKLLDCALDCGGQDNITFVLAQIVSD